MGNHSRISWKNAGIVTLGAFFLALLFSIGSQFLFKNISSIILSLLLLLAIILIGIFFDIIGVAAAAAMEAPLHAKAAKKLKGAKQAILVVRNADKIVSFCCDVVGDICGTLSGAIGVSLILRVFLLDLHTEEIIGTTIVTALIAAVTVGGKALGKTVAINKAPDIVFLVGNFLYWMENFLGLRIFNDMARKGRRV